MSIDKKEGFRRLYIIAAYVWSAGCLTATAMGIWMIIAEGDPVYYITFILAVGLAAGPGLAWLLWRSGNYVYDGFNPTDRN